MARPKNYGTFEVRETLHRPGGAVDVVVAYTRSARITTYSSYRHNPDRGWTCLNGAWTDLEQAIAETPDLEQGVPLRSPKLLRILTEALARCDTPAGATA